MVERIIFKYLFIANLEDKSDITINLHGQKYVNTHQPYIYLLSFFFLTKAVHIKMSKEVVWLYSWFKNVAETAKLI